MASFLRFLENSSAVPQFTHKTGQDTFFSFDVRKSIYKAADNAITSNPNSIQDDSIRTQLIGVVSNMNLIQSYPALLPPSSGSQSPELHGKPRKPR